MGDRATNVLARRKRGFDTILVIHSSDPRFQRCLQPRAWAKITSKQWAGRLGRVGFFSLSTSQRRLLGNRSQFGITQCCDDSLRVLVMRA